MSAIYKKELRSYFTSLIGYVFISFFLIIIGLYFVFYNIQQGSPHFESVFSSIVFAFMILVPIVTMRVMAEENHQKTDQLLLTAPVRTSSVILGKYLALMTVYGIVMLVSCCYPLILTRYGEVNLKSAYGAILGFYLLGGAFLAIGLFVSTCTDNQLIAAGVTFLIILFTMLIEGIANFFPQDNMAAWLIFSIVLFLICIGLYFVMHNVVVSLCIAAVGEAILTILYFVKPTVYDGAVMNVCKWFSVVSRYSDFVNGILNGNTIVYYLSYIFIFLFLAVQCLNKRRWN